MREKKCDSIKELSLAEDGHVTSCQQLSLSSCYELKKVTNLEVDILEKKQGLVILHDSSKQWQSPIGRTRSLPPALSNIQMDEDGASESMM